MDRKTQRRYAQAADAAEQLDPTTITGGTVYRGAAAATYGREVLEAVGHRAGRPSLDPSAEPGQKSRPRTLRLPSDLGAALEEYLEQHPGETFSGVIRQALQSFLADADPTAAERFTRSRELRKYISFYRENPPELDRAVGLLNALLSEALNTRP